MQECALIRDWNEHYAWPKLRSATVHEFLEQIDTKYGDRLPVYRAAYPDWWTDGFGSAARETAASRKTQSDMITIGGMLSMAGMAGDEGVEGMHDEMRRIHENLLFYDEHTFGAAESISDPQCENSQVQWAEKGSYVWEALKSAQMLYETSIGRLQGDLHRSERPTLTFFNPLGWERSALTTVYIDFEVIPRDRAFRLLDEQGHALSVEPIRSRSEGRYYAIWADRIPAMGYKTYEVVLDEGRVAGVGTHRELMETCPAYQEIALSQLTEEELADPIPVGGDLGRPSSSEIDPLGEGEPRFAPTEGKTEEEAAEGGAR